MPILILFDAFYKAVTSFSKLFLYWKKSAISQLITSKACCKLRGKWSHDKIQM